MRRALVSIAMIAATLLPTTAHAAPAAQLCDAGAFRQHDMAGRYVSETMVLMIYPCGGSHLTWLNDYGVHSASYSTVKRVDTGGVVARGYIPDPSSGAYLDLSTAIGYKPAEPGWIEVITVNGFTGGSGVYRLRKSA